MTDVIWRNDTTRQATVWYLTGKNGTSVRTPSNLPLVGSGWKIVGANDFGGDGTPDLVLFNNTTRQAQLWTMGGALGTDLLHASWLSYSGMPGWTLVVPR